MKKLTIAVGVLVVLGAGMFALASQAPPNEFGGGTHGRAVRIYEAGRLGGFFFGYFSFSRKGSRSLVETII